MSGAFPRLVCTAAATTATLLVTVPATAAPTPPGPAATADAAPRELPAAPGAVETRSVAALLTDLRRLYRQSEEATEAFNGTEEALRDKRAEVERLEEELARARLSLRDGRGAMARLARQLYQRGGAEVSPYLRVLLARDPQHAVEQGRVIRRMERDQVRDVERLEADERRTDALARAARQALDDQLVLVERRKAQRDEC